MFLMINKFHQQFEFVEDEIQSDHGGKFRWEQSSSAPFVGKSFQVSAPGHQGPYAEFRA